MSVRQRYLGAYHHYRELFTAAVSHYPVTTKVAVAELPPPSVNTMWLPGRTNSTVKVAAKFPLLSVMPLATTGRLLKYTCIEDEGANPVPLTRTKLPTPQLVGPNVIDGDGIGTVVGVGVGAVV